MTKHLEQLSVPTIIDDGTPLIEDTHDLLATMQRIGINARAAASVISQVDSQTKDQALGIAATMLRKQRSDILKANQHDLAAAQSSGLAASLLDRLALNETRIESMACGLEEITQQRDPIGTVLATWKRPNGLEISRVRVPLGVIGIIYESRPNVTADAFGLCLKSGNAAILRGGSESFLSSQAIAQALSEGIEKAGLPSSTIQLVPTTDRHAVGYMLKMTDTIDVIIPRGGRSLIERVSAESRIPVLKHLDGICHVYVARGASLDKAVRVTLNAKMRRTSICGAAETLLVDQSVVESHLPALVKALLEAGCHVRGDAHTQACDPRVEPVTEKDWDTEYLDAYISVGVVENVDKAIAHITLHGSQHTDAIITEDPEIAEYFLAKIDSAIVLWNASTQFADGGEFGMGAEIGISTDRLHARGPVGVEQLTTYKYVIRGNGQIRP